MVRRRNERKRMICTRRKVIRQLSERGDAALRAALIGVSRDDLVIDTCAEPTE